jgi:hypothetical protein
MSSGLYKLFVGGATLGLAGGVWCQVGLFAVVRWMEHRGVFGSIQRECESARVRECESARVRECESAQNAFCN